MPLVIHCFFSTEEKLLEYLINIQNLIFFKLHFISLEDIVIQWLLTEIFHVSPKSRCAQNIKCIFLYVRK